MKKGFLYFLMMTAAAIALQAKAQGQRTVYSQILCSSATAKYDVDMKRKELKISSLLNGKWVLNDVVKVSRLETHTIDTLPVRTEYVFNLGGKDYKISASFRGDKLVGTGEISYAGGNSSTFDNACERIRGKSVQTKR